MQLLETMCVRLTQQCNLACVHCRAGSSPVTSVYVDLERFKRFVLDAKRIGLRHVSVGGGEPGIDMRVGGLVTWLLSQCLKVTITTNGVAPLLRRLTDGGVQPTTDLRIRVSLDGSESVHDALRGAGTFAAAVVGLEKIRRWSSWVGVNTVVLPEVLTSIPELALIAREYSVDEWALITPVSQGSAAGRVLDVESTLKDVAEAKRMIVASRFGGRVVIWKFVQSPRTSVLVRASGEIVLGGVKDDDDVFMGTLTSYDLGRICEIIEDRNSSARRTFFRWSGWPQTSP